MRISKYVTKPEAYHKEEIIANVVKLRTCPCAENAQFDRRGNAGVYIICEHGKWTRVKIDNFTYL